MQDRVDLRREHFARAIALLPRGAEPVGIVAPAIKAWAMSGGKGCGLVEKEQLSPTSAFHHPAPPAAKFQHAGEPGVGRPALSEQRFGRGVMDDAAIAGEHPARGVSYDLAGRQHTVLQGHVRSPPPARWEE